ncbi:MAG: PD40 domain-containing protein [Thermodesulfovibrionales bacterium]|nr:PD40 domain-containing protein [Thermodesulfovibrionales bacterium]
MPEKRLNPLKLTSSFTPAPGMAAWSPDGRRIAYIARKLYVHDLTTDKRKKLPLGKPYFVAWGGDAPGILALYLEGDKTMLGIIDPDTLEARARAIPFRASAAYPLGGARGVLLVGSSLEKLRIGPRVAHELYHYDPVKDSFERKFHITRIYMPGAMRYDHLRSWLPSGPGPITERMLFAKIVVPPVAPHHVTIIAIDPLVGDSADLRRLDEVWVPEGASWSPSGTRVAISTDDGSLRLLGMDGSLASVDDSIKGRHPSWSPAGSQIYFGGHIINSDGTGKTPVLGNGSSTPGKMSGSMAWWGPEGTDMALSAGGRLWLLRDVATPSLLREDAPLPGRRLKSIRMLRELLMEELITGQEYKERYERQINLSVEDE